MEKPVPVVSGGNAAEGTAATFVLQQAGTPYTAADLLLGCVPPLQGHTVTLTRRSRACMARGFCQLADGKNGERQAGDPVSDQKRGKRRKERLLG